MMALVFYYNGANFSDKISVIERAKVAQMYMYGVLM